MINDNCPHCNAPQCKDQPYPGTHAYTIKYQCGYAVVYVVGEDVPEVDNSCPTVV